MSPHQLQGPMRIFTAQVNRRAKSRGWMHIFRDQWPGQTSTEHLKHIFRESEDYILTGRKIAAESNKLDILI